MLHRHGRAAVLKPEEPPRPAPPVLPLPPLPELPALSGDAGGYVRYLVQLMRDAALALHAVHAKGIVHRDVKPANLMLTADGQRVVLMDFGLAKGGSLSAGTTEAGGLMGTLRYAAPEQLAAGKQEVGPAADVRGLGVTFWELLTRRRLFAEARDEAELAEKVLRQDVPPLRTIDADFHPDLETILVRATERHPDDRIATAGKLAEYLQLYLDHKHLPLRRRTRLERLHGWVRDHGKAIAAVAAAVAVTVLLTTFIVHWLTPLPPPPDPPPKTDPALQRAEMLERTGLRKLEENELPASLLYLTEALKLQVFEKGRNELDRLRVASILRQCPQPVEVWAHDKPINWIEFSPDGTLAVTASDDGTARVWKVDTGEPMFAEPLRHDGPVRHAAFSPDGSQIVTASFDKTARVWHAATGRPLGGPLLHAMPLHHAAFSPDGQSIATASGYTLPVMRTVNKQVPDGQGGFKIIQEARPEYGEEGPPSANSPEWHGEARVWKLFSGDPVLLRHRYKVRKVLFAPDGRQLLSIGGWRPGEAQPMPAPEAPPAPVSGPYDSDEPPRPPFKSLKGPLGERVVELWDLATGKTEPLTTGTRDLVARMGTVFHCAFDTDRRLQITTDGGSWLVTLGADKQVVGPLNTEKPRWASWSRDGQRLAVGTGTVAEVWDTMTLHPVAPARSPEVDLDTALVQSGRGVNPFPVLSRLGVERPRPRELRHGRGIAITEGLFSPDGRWVITAGDDRKVRLWDAVGGRTIAPAFPLPANVRRVACSPDGRYLLLATVDHRAWLWDCAGGLPEARRLPFDRPFQRWFDLNPPRFHEQARRVSALFQSQPGPGGGMPPLIASVWDANTGTLVRPSLTLDGQAQDAVFSADGASLAVAGADGWVRIWDVAKGEVVRSRRYEGGVGRVAFSGNGRHLLRIVHPAGQTEGKAEAHVWDWDRDESRSVPLRGRGPVLLSPDGSHLAVAPAGSPLEVWEVATGRPIPLHEPPSKPETRFLAFSGDGRLLLAVGKDRTADLWDLDTGEVRNKDNPITHGESIVRAEFSKDNRYLLTASARTLPPGERPTAENQGEGEARVWDAVTGKAVSKLLRHNGPVHCASFSADGRFVLTVCANYDLSRDEVRLWRSVSGEPVTPVLPCPGACSDALLTPDGDRMETVDSSGILHEWPLRGVGSGLGGRTTRGDPVGHAPGRHGYGGRTRRRRLVSVLADAAPLPRPAQPRTRGGGSQSLARRGAGLLPLGQTMAPGRRPPRLPNPTRRGQLATAPRAGLGAAPGR